MIEKTFTFNAGAQFAPAVVAIDSAGNAVYAPSSTYHVTSAASNNAAVVKASAGRVWSITLANTVASDRWVKLYNKATPPAPGTDVPVRAVKVPASGSVSFNFAAGSYFSAGIGVAIVAGAADSDNTAVAAGDVILDIDYA